MTPDHETDTLEGLIASMEHEPRSFVDDDCVLRTSTINRHAATCKKCRAERILAGLREFRDEWVIDGTLRDRLDKWLGQSATGDSHGK